MLFDMRTLMVFVYWRLRREDQALAIWSVSNLVGSLGWLCIGLRYHIPNWTSIAVGNALLLLAWMLLWAGMRSFSSRPLRWPPVLVPAVTVLLLFLYIPPVRDNLVARVIVVNIGLMTCLLAVARDAWRDHQLEPKI